MLSYVFYREGVCRRAARVQAGVLLVALTDHHIGADDCFIDSHAILRRITLRGRVSPLHVMALEVWLLTGSIK